MYNYSKKFASLTRHMFATVELLPEAIFSEKTIAEVNAIAGIEDFDKFMAACAAVESKFNKALAIGKPIKVKPLTAIAADGSTINRAIDIALTDSVLTNEFGWTENIDVTQYMFELNLSTMFAKRISVRFDELESIADFGFVQQQKAAAEAAYVNLGSKVIYVLNALGIEYNEKVYHQALRSPGMTRKLRSLWAEEGFRRANSRTFRVFGLRFSDIFGENGERMVTMSKVEQWKAVTAYSHTAEEVFGFKLNVRDVVIVPERKADLAVPYNRILRKDVEVYASDIVDCVYGNCHKLNAITANPIDGAMLVNLDKALRMGLITNEEYLDLLGVGFQFRSNGGALKGYAVFVSGDALTAKLPITEFTDVFGDNHGKAEWLMLCDESVPKAFGCCKNKEEWANYVSEAELYVIRVSGEAKKVVKTSRQFIEKLPTLREAWLINESTRMTGDIYAKRTVEGFNAALSKFATFKPFIGCGIENSPLAHVKVQAQMRHEIVDVAMDRFTVEGTLADIFPDPYAMVAFSMNVPNWERYAHVKAGNVCINVYDEDVLLAGMRHPFNHINVLALVNQRVPALGETSTVAFCNITTGSTACVDGDYDGDEMLFTKCKALVDAACAMNTTLGMLFTGSNDFGKTAGKKSITKANYAVEAAKSTFAAFYYDGIGTGSIKMSRTSMAIKYMMDVSIDFCREILSADRHWVQLLVDSPKYECFAPAVDSSLAAIMKKYKVTDSNGRYSFASWLNEKVGVGIYTNKYRDVQGGVRPDDEKYKGWAPADHHSQIAVSIMENNLGEKLWDLPSFPGRTEFDPMTLTHQYYSRGNAVKKVELTEERCKVILAMLKTDDPARAYVVPGAKLSIVSIIKMLYKSGTRFLKSMAATMDDGAGMSMNKACFVARQTLARDIINNWVELIPSYGELDESKKIGLVWSILVREMVANNPRPMSDLLGEREGANGCLQWLLETIPEGLAQVLEDNGIEALTEGVAPVCDLEDNFDIDSVEEPRW